MRFTAVLMFTQVVQGRQTRPYSAMCTTWFSGVHGFESDLKGAYMYEHGSYATAPPCGFSV